LGHLRVEWRAVLKTDLQDVGWGDIDWLAQAQYRDMWMALVSVHKMRGFYYLCEHPLASHEGLYSVELVCADIPILIML